METIRIEAIDNTSVRAYVARPEGPPRACVIVVQEIFGVNDHIRWVAAKQYAAAGYLAVAPAFFDRVDGGQGAELGYTPDGVAQGRSRVDALGLDAPLRDIRAAQQQVAMGLPTGVVGYCWGGPVAYLCATPLGLPPFRHHAGCHSPHPPTSVLVLPIRHVGHPGSLSSFATAKRDTVHPDQIPVQWTTDYL